MGGGKGTKGEKNNFLLILISDRNPGQHEFIIVLDMIEILHLKINYL